MALVEPNLPRSNDTAADMMMTHDDGLSEKNKKNLDNVEKEEVARKNYLMRILLPHSVLDR